MEFSKSSFTGGSILGFYQVQDPDVVKRLKDAPDMYRVEWEHDYGSGVISHNQREFADDQERARFVNRLKMHDRTVEGSVREETTKGEALSRAGARRSITPEEACRLLGVESLDLLEPVWGDPSGAMNVQEEQQRAEDRKAGRK